MAHPSGEYPRARQEQILSSVGVDQEVARFKVTFDDTDGLNVLETAKGPTNEAENEGRRVATGIGSRRRAEVGGCQETNRPYDGVQIGLHQLLLEC